MELFFKNFFYYIFKFLLTFSKYISTRLDGIFHSKMREKDFLTLSSRMMPFGNIKQFGTKEI
jgi:hypothetical protein